MDKAELHVFKTAHDWIDEINNRYATKHMLCLYCGSGENNGLGIVHEQSCILLIMRRILDGYERG